MTQEQFIYWLQGFAEVQGTNPDSDQWDMIKRHLSSVLINITTPPVHVEPFRPNDSEQAPTYYYK